MSVNLRKFVVDSDNPHNNIINHDRLIEAYGALGSATVGSAFTTHPTFMITLSSTQHNGDRIRMITLITNQLDADLSEINLTDSAAYAMPNFGQSFLVNQLGQALILNTDYTLSMGANNQPQLIIKQLPAQTTYAFIFEYLVVQTLTLTNKAAHLLLVKERLTQPVMAGLPITYTIRIYHAPDSGQTAVDLVLLDTCDVDGSYTNVTINNKMAGKTQPNALRIDNLPPLAVGDELLIKYDYQLKLPVSGTQARTSLSGSYTDSSKTYYSLADSSTFDLQARVRCQYCQKYKSAK